MSTKPVHRENPFTNILFNILLPVVILQQVSKRLGEQGPLVALILALAFPIGYGLWDYFKNRHKNYVSLFGLASVLFTGGFALMHLEGIWFAIKEAAFPGLMAIGVFASAFSRKPLIAALFCNPQVLKMESIELRLHENNQQPQFNQLLKSSTIWLSLSFVISSVLNYVIARNIFVPVDATLPSEVQSEILNQQIAKMTGMGFVAIALPMMVLTGLVLFAFLRRLGQMTGLKIEELIQSH